METIGKVLRKTGAIDAASQSVHKTTQYEKLTQEPSDEEVEDDVVFIQESAAYHRNGFAAADIRNHIQAADDAVLSGLLQKGSVSSKKPVGTDLIEVKMARLKCGRQLMSKRFAAILCVVLIILTVTLISIIVSSHRSLHVSKPTSKWVKEYGGYATESCIRLFDVDEDGKLDIIFSATRVQNVTMPQLFDRNASQQAMEDLCKRLGEAYPCIGELIALRGNDSRLLWSLRTHMGLFELNCDKVDVNKDGKPDCIGTGRFGTVIAFDPRTGSQLWRATSEHFMGAWSSFGAVLLPDFTDDGVPELLVPHSSDPRFADEEHNRYAGRLFMLDGATGKTIGRYMPVPENRETYMQPVLHTLNDGSQFIIFGHGGETIPGGLLTISLPDFYNYVMQLPDTNPVPKTRGHYNQWNSLSKLSDNKFVREIYRSKTYGVMVPPVCVDVNMDGTKDLLMVAHDGTCTLFDGQSLAVLWTVSFSGSQSYSSPAPGYFNDDEFLDFMIHLNFGSFPSYNYSMAVVIDGKTGKTIWSMASSHRELLSAMVARTTQPHHDVFVFRAGGQLNLDSIKLKSQVKQRSARQLSSKRYQPTDQRQARRYGTILPRRAKPGSWRDPVDDSSYPRYRASGMGRAEPMRSRSRMGSNIYDDPSADGRGYQDGQGSVYEYEDGNRNGQGQDIGGEGYGNADDNPPSSEQLVDEDIPSSTLQPTTVTVSLVSTTTSTVRPPPVCDAELLDKYSVTQFVVDRNTVSSPLRIFKDVPIAFNYTLIESDENHKRIKRHEEHAETEHKTHATGVMGCLYMKLDELTTGALGDVDGDGSLDLVSIACYSAIIRDQAGEYVRTEKRTKISKYNLELVMVRSKDFVGFDSSTGKNNDSIRGFGRLRPTSEQPWAAYLGTGGDSVYSSN